MPIFLARVELHGGDHRYPDLYRKMQAKGFSRNFLGGEQVFQLPLGTYCSANRYDSRKKAMAAVVDATTAIGFPPDRSRTGAATPNSCSIVVVTIDGLAELGLKSRPRPAMAKQKVH